jgi:purine operon repressor
MLKFGEEEKRLMKRTDRVGAIIKILTQNPSKSFSLGYFAEKFGAAKSSISEDLSVARKMMQTMELGIIETSAGAAGGVRYIPHISDREVEILLRDLCNRLADPGRILAGGFLYTSDIMFDSTLARRTAEVFARKFSDKKADYIITVETKGIPVALMTADLLNLPLVVIRRESKISEGSTLSINYFSGSTDRIQKMSIAKRAIQPGTKAIIIDDFMRAGGSAKGISDMMKEFDVEIVGTGVVIASRDPEKKKVEDYFPLVYLGKVDENSKKTEVFPNPKVF